MAALVAAWIASARGRGGGRALRRAQTPIGDPEEDDFGDDDWDDDDDDAPDEDDDDEEPMQLAGGGQAQRRPSFCELFAIPCARPVKRTRPRVRPRTAG